MKITKKILSVLLSLMLVLGTVAVGGMSASAAVNSTLGICGETVIENGEILKNSGTGWRYEGDTDSGKIILDNLTYTGEFIFANNLDLEITGNANLTSTGLQPLISVNNDGNLTLNGSFTLSLQDFGMDMFTVTGNLTVSGGSLNVVNTGASSAIWVYGTMTVDGGSVYAKANGNGAIFVQRGLTVNGGSVYAKTETGDHAFSYGGDLTLNNGEAFALGDWNAKEVLISALGGKGTASEPYEIYNYGGLKEFSSIVNGTNVAIAQNTAACAKVMKDITASAGEWVPIGNDNHKYSGTFDGLGHKITGLFVGSKPDQAGLFGCIGEDGKVKNVTVDSADFTGNYSGCIAGVNRGSISFCAGSGSINGAINAGGLVGYNNGTIENSWSTCSVKAEKHIEEATGLWSIMNYAGGIVGFQNDGLTKNCYSAGSVALNSTVETDHQATVDGYTGGIAGCVNQGRVENCYSFASASFNAEATAPNLSRINAFKGGVTGSVRSGEVQRCYYDNEKCDIPGAVYGADTGTAKGLTTAEMTGESALENMVFEYEAGEENPWLTKANEGIIKFYPHLKGFNLNDNGTQLSAGEIEPENWPAKIERKSDPEITISVSPEEPTGDDELTVTVSLPDDATGTVTLTVDGTDYVVPIVDGKAACDIGNLYPGPYYFTASYGGDGNYDAVTKEINVAVSKCSCNISIEISPEEPVEGHTAIITVSFPDDATGAILLDIDGIGCSLPIEYGKAVFDFGKYPLRPGEITASVSYEGDNKYDAVNVSKSFILKTEEAPNMTLTAEDITYGETATVTANLPADNMNGSVTFYLDGADTGKKVSVMQGTAVCEYDGLKAGDHTVEAVFANDDKYADETKTVTFNVEQKELTITANDQTYPFNGQIQGEGNTVFEGPGEKVTVEGLIPGDTLSSIILDGQAKDIGEYPDSVVPSSAQIKNGNGQDVTTNYNITYTSGKLTITSVNAPLTINYVYANGGEAAETHTEDVEIFTGYSVTSPEITGYAPDKATVEGTMGNLNGVTETVTYTAIEYTATFIADGETVEEITYTIETESIDAPEVPAKEGFTGEWEEYELTPGGITVNAVYTENEPEDVCPLDNEDHGDGFFGRVRTFIHTLIWKAFRFLGLDVFFKVS